LDEVLAHYKNDIYIFTNEAYSLLYSNFNKLWVERKITDFMKFNIMLEEFIKTEAVELINKNINTHNFY
jgi:hypothetical protein